MKNGNIDENIKKSKKPLHIGEESGIIAGAILKIQKKREINMKKTTTLLLLVAMLLSTAALSACGDASTETTNTKETTGDTDTQVEETEQTDGLPDTDMAGFTLSMLHYDESWLSWAETIMDAEEETGERLNDAVYQRNMRIEDRFNCKLNIQSQPQVNPEDIEAATMSGDTTYDVFFCYDLRVFWCGDSLLAWEELPYVDLDAEWWNPMATGVFNIGGKTYATAGNYSLSVLSRASGFAFNKEIYNNLGSDIDLYASVEEGTWTLDKMAKLCEMATLDLNGDGIYDDKDQYGVTGNWKETFWRFIEGSGIKMVDKDDAGYPVFNLVSNENAVDKMMRIFDLFCTSNIYFNMQNGSKDSCETGEASFKNGNFLFEINNFFGLENLRSYDIEIGFIPCPKYDEEQSTYYSPSFGAEISVLTKTLPEDRKENVGMLLEAMAFDTNKYLIPEYKEVLLKTKYSRDEDSAAAVDIIIDTICFDFGINAWQEVVGGPIIDKIYMKGENNVVSTLTQMQNSVDAEIQSLKDLLAE